MTGPQELPVTTQPDALLAAARWIEALLLGPFATALAVIAVGVVGLMTLSGRLNVRRAATVLIGCFVLFGAGAIAQGGRRTVHATSPTTPLAEVSGAHFGRLPAQPDPSNSGETPDPYAGAAIRR